MTQQIALLEMIDLQVVEVMAKVKEQGFEGRETKDAIRQLAEQVQQLEEVING